MAKTAQLQIRVTPREKARLKKLAVGAGQDVSSYVLSRALQPERDRFASLMRRLGRGDGRSYVLAEVHDLLVDLPAARFRDAVSAPPGAGLSPYLRNYVAAMVELAAVNKHIDPPLWVREVEALTDPHFVTSLKSIRMHLLQASPVAFKRRNIFVDAAVGDRV